MGDSLDVALQEHHSRFIAPLGRITGDEVVRELIIVICCPEAHFEKKFRSCRSSGVAE
jgi:hypothetical protein